LYRAAPVFEQLENLRPPAARQQAAPGGSLLDDMIGQTESRAARAEDAGDLAAFIERVSAHHLEDRPDAGKEAWKAKVKAAAVRLALLGRGVRAAGATLLAEGLPPGGQEEAAWQELRRSAEAPWIGLALPRFLVRLPYGTSTSPVESLEFEEMPESVHSD